MIIFDEAMIAILLKFKLYIIAIIASVIGTTLKVAKRKLSGLPVSWLGELYFLGMSIFVTVLITQTIILYYDIHIEEKHLGFYTAATVLVSYMSDMIVVYASAILKNAGDEIVKYSKFFLSKRLGTKENEQKEVKK
jgi:hypothetical protein